MSSKPSVSVVIDNFNYARYLGQAIESALSQSFPRDKMEVLVVDDGSTDVSEAVCRRYSREGVLWVAKTHGGQSSCLNAGIVQARGEFVALLDADDYWRPEKLDVAVDFLRGNPDVGFVQHLLEKVDGQGQLVARGVFPDPAIAQGRWSLEDFLAGRTRFSSTSGFVFRAKALEPILPIPEDLPYSSDTYLYHHAIFYSAIGHLPCVLGSYRIHGQNQSSQLQHDRARILEHLRFVQRSEEYLDKRLKQFDAAMAPGIERTRQRDRLKRQVLLSRLDDDWRGALRSWASLLRLEGPGRYALFEALALSAAVVSPSIYLYLLRCYSSSRLLLAVRERCLPEP